MLRGLERLEDRVDSPKLQYWNRSQDGTSYHPFAIYSAGHHRRSEPFEQVLDLRNRGRSDRLEQGLEANERPERPAEGLETERPLILHVPLRARNPVESVALCINGSH
jgi:hypothetical protein